MRAMGVSHIAVCVRDLEKSLEFYRDVLGMKVKMQATQPMAGRAGAESAEMYQGPHEARTVANVWFEGANGPDGPDGPDGSDVPPFLVLTSHPGDAVGGDPIKLDQIGISHISFTVDDINSVAAELEAKRVPLAGALEDFTNDEGVVRTIFVYDPDGILVQFDEGPR